MNILEHRTSEVIANITAATTPHAKAAAEREGLAVKAALEKEIGDIRALAEFKSAAHPKTSIGIWKGPSS